jgi:sn-glycerol 3-phosphate transport system ATP-binding protein
MARVELHGVRKVYPNGFKAIHGVDLDILDGELVVLVGPSGCGKSTLLRMIAGLETVSEGMVRIGEREVNNLEPAERDIAMVFQNYALYPHMSVFDNMAYGLRNRKIPKHEIERRVGRAAEILHIEGFLKRRPRELSGGQRQRVAMGRAIVREPAAFLFDEPLSNLDAKLRVKMRLEIKKLQESLGTTSIYVTHDQVEAMTLAHRLVVMNAGRAEQIGTPLEVYDRPATVFVAGFIGSPSMNFISAELSPDGSAISLNGGQTLRLAPEAAPSPQGGSLIVGMRPEHLEVAADTFGELLPLDVELVEPLGADTLVHGRLNGEELTARLPGHATCVPGQRLSLKVEAENLHLFNADSGQRISN